MAELSTLGPVIAKAYEDEPNRNTFTDAAKDKVDNMFSGAYADLTGKPTLSPAASSGSYADLIGKPTLDFVPLTQKGATNGVAPLDAAGLVPLVHLNVGGLSFKGAWNPVTNSPQLIDGTGSVGDFYKAGVAGTRNTGNGSFTYAVGDWIIYAGGTWQRLGSTDAVAMVNGKIGQVTLTAADVGARPSSYVPAWSEVTTKPALVTSVNGQSGAVTVDGATWDTLPGKPTLTNTVNGQSGTVVLNATSVGARPSTYVPTWDEVTGKPTQRGTIGPAIPAVLARLSANTNIPSSTETTLVWGSMVRDPFSMWSAGTGTFTVPSWAKFARATVSLYYSGNATGERQSSFRVNGSTVVGSGVVRQDSPGANGFVQTYTTSLIPVASGNTLTLLVWQSAGVALPIQNTTATWLSIELYE